MSYYTRYELSFPELNEEGKDSGICSKIRKEVEETSGCGSSLFEDVVKWYDFKSDMREVSALYPTVLMVLHGEGEESGDLWGAYFLGGKMQLCQAEVTYPEYDETKLQ